MATKRRQSRFDVWRGEGALYSRADSNPVTRINAETHVHAGVSQFHTRLVVIACVVGRRPSKMCARARVWKLNRPLVLYMAPIFASN